MKKIVVKARIIQAEYALLVIFSNMIGYNPRRLEALKIMKQADVLTKEDVAELRKQEMSCEASHQMLATAKKMGREHSEKFLVDNMSMFDEKNWE